MKLLTKHHSYFFSLYLPILLITTIIGVYCQAQTISVLISTQWLLILSCGIVLCIAKKTPIHQRQAAKPWMQSMASLCLFQFALWAHLISLYHLSMTTLPVAMPTQAGPYLTQITTNPYYTTLFFPWPFYTLLGLSIAVYCYQPNKQGFLSDATAPIIGNKKMTPSAYSSTTPTAAITSHSLYWALFFALTSSSVWPRSQGPHCCSHTTRLGCCFLLVYCYPLAYKNQEQ